MPEGPTLAGWVVPRARLVGSGLAAGLVLGTVAALVLAGVRSPDRAEELVFAVGTLVLGFATLGWAGSIMAGRGIETMQEQLDVSQGWSERDSRRAMARLVGAGLGLMVGASVAVLPF